MSAAALLVCTTLITNVGNGSTVTRECHAVEPQQVVATAPTDSSIAPQSPATITIKETSLEAAPKRNELIVPKTDPAPELAKPVEQAVVQPPEAAVPVEAKPAEAKPADTISVEEIADPAPPAPVVAPAVAMPAPVAAKPAVASVRRAKPKHMRVTSHAPRRRKHVAPRATVAPAETYAIVNPAIQHQPPKKRTVWDSVKNLFD